MLDPRPRTVPGDLVLERPVQHWTTQNTVEFAGGTMLKRAPIGLYEVMLSAFLKAESQLFYCFGPANLAPLRTSWGSHECTVQYKYCPVL